MKIKFNIKLNKKFKIGDSIRIRKGFLALVGTELKLVWIGPCTGAVKEVQGDGCIVITDKGQQVFVFYKELKKI